jgi:AraC-like DNA-binding protein
MDPLADLLDGVRARGALFGQAVLDPPWGLRFASGAPLTLTAMLRGRAWLVPEQGPPVPLRPGEVAVVRGPAPYTVADDPATAPGYTVLADAYCARSDGTDVGESLTLRPRTCGPRPDGAALLLSGAYSGSGGIGERLLRALPPLLVIPGRGAALGLLAEEVEAERPGQHVVLDRLLDLALVAALRDWFDAEGQRAPLWYRSTRDPVVDLALRLLHEAPARPWTVAALAAETGVSRAALARRFTAGVGQPPMSYLAGWRVAVAADLLRESDATVAAVARRVGYSDAFALSVAFKRLRGRSPTEHRLSAAG